MSLNNQVITLSREELLSLALHYGAKSIIGMNLKSADFLGIDSKHIGLDEGLRKGKQISGHSEASEINKLFQVLFHPEKALLVVRELPKVGKQILIFLCQAGKLLLHSFPQEGQHRIEPLTAAQMEKMLLDWFPMKTGPFDAALQLKDNGLVKLIEHVDQGKLDKAVALLSILDSGVRDSLIESIQLRKWSGSFVLLEIENEEAKDAYSFIAWSTGIFTWTVTSHKSPDVLTLMNGGDTFVGQLRMAIRSLAHMEGAIRSYTLSSTELAFAFALLNQNELANRILKSLQTNNLDQTWKQAGDVLIARGLARVSSLGITVLSDDLEQALAPVILHSQAGEISTISGTKNYNGTLYILKKRMFCIHFNNSNLHVLECGNIAQLPDYLKNLFRGFGQKKIIHQKTARISLNALTSCLHPDLDKQLIENRLTDNGLAQDLASALATDLVNHEYRASLTVTKKKANQGSQRSPTHSLLLLKGNKTDWLFSLAGGETGHLGQLMPADVEKLDEEFRRLLD